jgi:hypothetical protein
MALTHTNITVGTTPTPLVTLPNGVGYVAVSIYNNDNASIYLGDSAVSVSAGLNQGSVLAKNTFLQIWMHGNETIYAVSSGGTSTGAVSVIYSA